MRITVIGTINKDLILPFNHAPIESFGGIFYDLVILAQLLDPGDVVTPVSYLGQDVEGMMRAVLAKIPVVNPEGLLLAPERHHKVILEYTAPEERDEKSLFPFPPLTWEQIEPHLDADMIIVNLVTGWDLERDAFLKLKAVAGDRLYVDIHYLVMGVDSLGRRFIQPPENLEDWVRGVRFVQMNEREFGVVGQGTRNEVAFFQANMNPDQVLLATKGGAGAEMIYQRSGMVARKLHAGYKPPRFIDTTGCGDAFGAGFVFRYLQSGRISDALDFATLVGAANCALQGTNEMHRLRETMDGILRQLQR